MDTVEQTKIEAVTITESAAKVVQGLFAERNLEGYALRIYISGRGCSGFQYGMALDNRIRPEDTVIEMHNVKVLVDEVSVQYMFGSTIDYVTGPSASGFKIENPNAYESTCNCGQSSADSADSAGSGCACGDCN